MLYRFLARLFYKTEEVLSPPARRRRLRLRPVKFWGKLLRQKIMSSFISSSTQNLFIFAPLIHKVVLIDNQALVNIHLYYFFYIPPPPHILALFQLRKNWCGKIIKAKSCPVLYQVQLRIFSYLLC